MEVTPNKNPKKPKKRMKTSIKRRKYTEEKGIIANSEFDKLTADLKTSIFVRCPVKTLSVLKCVSKSWNDLIISPSFYSHHLNQSTEKAPQLLIMDRSSLGLGCAIRFVKVDPEEEERERNESYAVTLPGLFWCSWIVCYGLVCVSTGDHFIYLCNPAMQQSCKLPKCSPTAYTVPRSVHVGFGYLHSKKEYKVVHFFYRRSASRRRYPLLEQLRCEVFTINGVGRVSNSRWKEITDMPPYRPFLQGLLINECMYWFGQILIGDKSNSIFLFDFENEKFLTISQPSSFETLSGLSMLDLKGMLCLVDEDHFRESSILDLWILKDKVNCIWVKEYSINLVNFGSGKSMSIFGTWNEEIIFRDVEDVFFYDFKRNCFRRVKNVCKLDIFATYRESLFSLEST